MATLALNSMTQPSGRVCGFHSRYRTYLRSSPLICILDPMLTVLRFVQLTLKKRSQEPDISLLETLGLVLDERFYDIDDVRSVGSSTWIRWILFVMGPLPQAIRLASFRGVRWNQMVGACFLVSWIWCEVLIGLAESGKIPTFVPLPRDRVSCKAKRPEPVVDWSFVVLGALISTFCVLHCGFHAVVFTSFSSWYVVIVLLSSVVSLFIYAVVMCLLFMVFANLFKRCPRLGRSMLVVFPRGKEHDGDDYVDDIALFLLVLFLLNLWGCIVGYANFYDPNGTINPGWTGVFGRSHGLPHITRELNISIHLRILEIAPFS